MTNIPEVQSRRIFTTALTAKFDELASEVAPSFLSSFFPKKKYETKGVSFDVRRAGRQIATDVIRGSQGNYNETTKFTEKQFIPAYFYEKYPVDSLSKYDVPMGVLDFNNVGVLESIASDMGKVMFELQQKIERSVELQASQVLQTGIVTLTNGDNVDYKRKATMKETLSGDDLWSATGVDIMERFEIASQKLRQEGRIQGGQKVYCIMGLEAYQAFRNDAAIKDKDNLFTTSNLDISTREHQTTGGQYIGSLKAGGNTCEIWVYDETYDNASGTAVDFFDSKTVAWIPESLIAETSFCGVPELPAFLKGSKRGISMMRGLSNQAMGYVIDDYVNQETETWYGRIKAAPLVIPKSVDRMYTAIVLA